MINIIYDKLEPDIIKSANFIIHDEFDNEQNLELSIVKEPSSDDPDVLENKIKLTVNGGSFGDESIKLVEEDSRDFLRVLQKMLKQIKV